MAGVGACSAFSEVLWSKSNTYHSGRLVFTREYGNLFSFLSSTPFEPLLTGYMHIFQTSRNGIFTPLLIFVRAACSMITFHRRFFSAVYEKGGCLPDLIGLGKPAYLPSSGSG